MAKKFYNLKPQQDHIHEDGTFTVADQKAAQYIPYEHKPDLNLITLNQSKFDNVMNRMKSIIIAKMRTSLSSTLIVKINGMTYKGDAAIQELNLTNNDILMLYNNYAIAMNELTAGTQVVKETYDMMGKQFAKLSEAIRNNVYTGSGDFFVTKSTPGAISSLVDTHFAAFKAIFEPIGKVLEKATNFGKGFSMDSTMWNAYVLALYEYSANPDSVDAQTKLNDAEGAILNARGLAKARTLLSSVFNNLKGSNRLTEKEMHSAASLRSKLRQNIASKDIAENYSIIAANLFGDEMVDNIDLLTSINKKFANGMTITGINKRKTKHVGTAHLQGGGTVKTDSIVTVKADFVPRGSNNSYEIQFAATQNIKEYDEVASYRTRKNKNELSLTKNSFGFQTINIKMGYEIQRMMTAGLLNQTYPGFNMYNSIAYSVLEPAQNPIAVSNVYCINAGIIMDQMEKIVGAIMGNQDNDITNIAVLNGYYVPTAYFFLIYLDALKSNILALSMKQAVDGSTAYGNIVYINTGDYTGIRAASKYLPFDGLDSVAHLELKRSQKIRDTINKIPITIKSNRKAVTKMLEMFSQHPGSFATMYGNI